MTFLWLLEGLRNPFFDKVMQFITYFGEELLILVVICAFYWCVDKKFAYQMGLIYFTAGLGVQALKITFRVPRPWILDPDFPVVESALDAATGYSFPSGHTQGVTCLFFPLALRSRKTLWKILCIAAFLLVGFSRMYLGCHTPQDVFVSMALSLIVTGIIWRFSGALLESKKHLGRIAFVLASISIATAVYALFLYENGTIAQHYAEDCCKAAGAGLGFAIGFYVERKYVNFSTETGSRKTQLLKLVIGLLGALILKLGLSLLPTDSIYVKMAEYLILVLWILIFYPVIFRKNFCKRKMKGL